MRKIMASKCVLGLSLTLLVVTGCAAPETPPPAAEEPSAPVLQPALNRIGGKAMVLVLDRSALEKALIGEADPKGLLDALRADRSEGRREPPPASDTRREVIRGSAPRGSVREDRVSRREAWSATP